MSLPTNPYPLGQLLPGAAFASVAIQAIVNVASKLEPGLQVADLVIQAASANKANLFITNDGKPAAADYSNVLRELPPGAFYSAGSPASLAFVQARYAYVAAQNDTDFAFGEVRE